MDIENLIIVALKYILNTYALVVRDVARQPDEFI